MRQCGATVDGPLWVKCDRCNTRWEPPLWDGKWRPDCCHEKMMLAKERELHELIQAERKIFERRVQPYLDELSRIDMCKGPPPIVSEDGRTFVYVGPRAKWTPDGIEYDAIRAPSAGGPEDPDQEPILPG